MPRTCSDCNGTARCRSCKGSGKADYPGWGKPGDRPCTWCQGSGVCQRCRGTGQLL